MSPKIVCYNPKCGQEVNPRNYCVLCSQPLTEAVAVAGAYGLMAALAEFRAGKLASADFQSFRNWIFSALSKCTLRELLNIARGKDATFNCTKVEALVIITALDEMVSDKKGFGG